MALKGQIVLVTGGSRGIGRMVVEKLAHDGAKVFFTYHQHGKDARELETVVTQKGGWTKGIAVDVREKQAIKDLTASIFEKEGRIDALINNAGIKRDRTALLMRQEEWEEVLQTNLTGLFLTIQAVLPYMLRHKAGRIVNISSVSGQKGIAGQTNYTAAKAGIDGLTRALAKELAPCGITVNAVAPGAVETAMLDDLSPSRRQALLDQVPMKRAAQAEEVAMVVQFLVDRSLSPDYLTGQVIALDGGMG